MNANRINLENAAWAGLFGPLISRLAVTLSKLDSLAAAGPSR
jgi:hypothetical protein